MGELTGSPAGQPPAPPTLVGGVRFEPGMRASVGYRYGRVEIALTDTVGEPKTLFGFADAAAARRFAGLVMAAADRSEIQPPRRLSPTVRVRRGEGWEEL